MSINKLLTAYVVILIACSCNNKQTATAVAETDSVQIKEYFPVYDFLYNEKLAVDSLAIGLKYYSTVNRKTDSGYIGHPEFSRLVSGLLNPGLQSKRFQADFRETSFYDKSSKTSTFMYQPVNINNQIRRVDILTKATDTYDKVSSIYIESTNSGKDSSVLSKMIWQTGRSMQLNQQVNISGKPVIERQIKVVWNNWEEQE